jgi:hypothetical protein
VEASRVVLTLTAQLDLENPNGFIRDLVQELQRLVQKALVPLVKVTQAEAARLLEAALRTSPEYAALTEGRLREELGLESPREQVDSVVQAAAAGVRCQVTREGLVLDVFHDRFQEALAATGARYVSVNKHGMATPVPWLEWLLFAGTTRVTVAELLYDHPRKKVSFRKGSRTGKAIMINRRAGFASQGYRIPPEFSGTENNNWLTRSADLALPALAAFVEGRLGQLGGK